MELKMKLNESYEDFVCRCLENHEQYEMNKQDMYYELLGKELAYDECRKRSYLAQDIKNALELKLDSKFRPKGYNPKKKEQSIVLVIGDIHAPFTLKGYLQFCKKMYDKWNCNKVVFIGDILDNHVSSYHETDPDGMGAGYELSNAEKIINEFYSIFPEAKVCTGNHDAIPNRKAFSNGLSNRWIKSISEVVNTPNWEYKESFIIDGVEYCHGTGRVANARMKDDNISVVQGHYHSKSYIEFWQGKNGIRNFAMQIGCGIDETAYAFAYGKNFAKPHINVGIIIDGKLPIIEYMDNHEVD